MRAPTGSARGRSALRNGRLWPVAVVVALLGTLTAACTTPTPTTPSAQQFCEFWDKVQTAPPTEDQAVLVKDDVVALAEDTTIRGQSCTDASAKVELDGAVLAEGTELPTEEGNPESLPVAAVTGDEIAPGAPVLENLSVQTLSAEIGMQGITLRGNVNVRLSGVTSTIGFVGTLSNLDNWSVSLSSSALTIPGITTTPVTFAGTLRVSNGVPSLSLSAQATSVKVGDVVVNQASINLTASPTVGVTAAVSGAIKVGPSTANGSIEVTFDKAGALVAARGDVSAHLVGTQAGGKKIDLQGTVTFEGNAQETAASFSGSGIVGDLIVNAAHGDLTLATNRATFVGVLDVAQGPNTVRFDGSIVWDGITAYTPFLNLQGAGSFSGTLNDGRVVSVTGTLDTTIVGGQLRTVVEGDFKVGTLRATGSAVVETNGSTTALLVSADLVDAGFAGRLEGAVVITDGLTELVDLDASVTGSVQLGDVTLQGATLQIDTTYGNPLDIRFAGALKVGNRADLNGSVKASFGPNGTLIALDGQMNGSLLLDSWGVLGFSGQVIASPEQVSLSGAGNIRVINFPLGIDFNGTFVSSRTTPSWKLHGSGRFRIASIEVASARLTLDQQAGMKATRVGFYFAIIGIPTYFEADFYMKPEGGCSKVDITGGSIIARPLLKLVLPGVIGCPVH